MPAKVDDSREQQSRRAEHERCVLFVGDVHADDRTPRSRRDDYLDATIVELTEVMDIAAERHVDAVVFLGDIFHRPDPGGRCRNAVLRLLAERTARAPGMRLITVEGNHDTDNAPHTLPHTALGTLIEAGVLERIPVADDDLRIGFVHHYPGVEADLAVGRIRSAPNVRIWAIHAYVSTEPVRWTYVPFDNLPLNPECRLVVAGHIHARMEGRREDGVRFINPGSICRNRMEEQMLHQMPHVLLVRYPARSASAAVEEQSSPARAGDSVLSAPAADTDDFTCTLIPLQSARPANEIFRIAEAAQRKGEQAETQRYLEKLRNVSVSGRCAAGGDEYESLRLSGEAKGIDVEVVDLAIAILREVRGGNATNASGSSSGRPAAKKAKP